MLGYTIITGIFLLSPYTINSENQSYVITEEF